MIIQQKCINKLGSTFSLWMYLLIWFFGSSFALYGFFHVAAEEFNDNRFGKLAILALIAVGFFAILSMLHQMMIYISLHELEHKSHGWELAAPSFIGTTADVLIRVSSFFLLLLIGQKISLQYLHEKWPVFPPHDYFLPILCSLLFLLLFVWDILALLKRGVSARYDGWRNGNQADKALAIIMAADFVAFIYWTYFTFDVVLHMTAPEYLFFGTVFVLLFYTWLIVYRLILLGERRVIVPEPTE